MRHLIISIFFTLCAGVVHADRVTPSARVRIKLDVRKEPANLSPVVGSLWVGQTAQVLDGDSPNGWLHVRLDSEETGYVPRDWSKVLPRTLVSVHFLDVDGGDAIIVDMGDSEIVIDGGASARTLHDYASGIIDGPIELVIVTNAAAGHWKGLRRLIGLDSRGTETHDVLEYWDPGYAGDCVPGYETFFGGVSRMRGIKMRRPLANSHPPMTQTGLLEPIALLSLPDVEIVVLHTDSAPEGTDCEARIESSSVVIRLDFDGARLVIRRGTVDLKELEAANPRLLRSEIAELSTDRNPGPGLDHIICTNGAKSPFSCTYVMENE